VTPNERFALALRRLALVLNTQTVSSARTLEQKISDAGPTHMRIDPHILTEARKQLVRQGVIGETRVHGVPWYHLARTPPDKVQQRLDELTPIHRALQDGQVLQRTGQALEIAVYRALSMQSAYHTFGAYLDLDEHDDSTLYRKEEPPSAVSGQLMMGKIDFLLVTSDGLAAVEVKNLREWLYPDRVEIRELLSKAVAIDAVPVMIARRIPYVTFRLLSACGVVMHQTYNQRLAAADQELAERAKRKDLLGFHDIRLGNEPDGRLNHFVSANLSNLVSDARKRFEENGDLLANFASGAMGYDEFAARIRRREGGTDEGSDWNL
jgi:hypothetical protein